MTDAELRFFIEHGAAQEICELLRRGKYDSSHITAVTDIILFALRRVRESEGRNG